MSQPSTTPSSTSRTIVIVTGNPNKLKEIAAILPKKLQYASQKLDLDEMQSLDLHAIVSHKLRQAYDLVQQPVVVEDVSAELAGLQGLPGPFVKFFVEKLGRGALYELSRGTGNDAVTIRCLAGYYDGNTMLFGEGIVRGHIVAPRGEHGFGFDSTVVPEGETRTVAEMPSQEKNRISHRARAMRDLLTKIYV